MLALKRRKELAEQALQLGMDKQSSSRSSQRLLLTVVLHRLEGLYYSPGSTHMLLTHHLSKQFQTNNLNSSNYKEIIY